MKIVQSQLIYLATVMIVAMVTSQRLSHSFIIPLRYHFITLLFIIKKCLFRIITTTKHYLGLLSWLQQQGFK